MATLNELSYNILNIARGGLSSDDDRLNIRQIKFWIKYYRAIFIKKDVVEGSVVDPQLIQDLGCLKLQEVDKADCPTNIWEENIKRVEIPKLIDLPARLAITWVGLIDKQTPIVLAEPSVVYFKRYQRFTGDMRRAYFIGKYIYVTDPFNEDICEINLRGIFDNPTEISYTSQDGTEECWTDDRDYPIPLSYVSMITSTIMERELQMTVASTNDEINDSREPNNPIDDREQVSS
jgi:hypothetical protein